MPVLKDIGTLSSPSMTNSMEAVVQWLVRETEIGKKLAGMNKFYFFYYDSDSMLTGVHCVDGKFHSFFMPNEVVCKECVEPNAQWVACTVCYRPIKTCERVEPVDNDYLCPAHGDGSELSDGKWVCSDECWDRIVTLGEEEK